MATGPAALPELYPVKGIRLGIASAGIKKPGRKDTVVIELAEGSSVAGMYTTNAFCAAPVQLTKAHMESATPRYLLINTGNANAGTGEPGMQAALKSCEHLASLTGVGTQQVLPFSTGVIGEQLPVDRLCAALPDALANLDAGAWLEAAEGIMTTDTRPKAASVQFQHQGKTAIITGITKGAGMIKPNMATMLAFVATDAKVEPALLARLQQQAVEYSFNRITIDGDTSTNDCSMLIATGQSDLEIKTDDSALQESFLAALKEVYQQLAQAIVRDGEGATKFVSVVVQQAQSEAEALRVAYAVAESPLVKTALFASDPNWGRILAATGRAGLDRLDIAGVSIWLDEVCIVKNGGVAPDYTEAAGAAVMAQDDIRITIALGRGSDAVTVWTSDLSYDYVKINAEYRT